MAATVVGFMDLSKFDKPKKSVSFGAKKLLKDAKNKKRIKSLINRTWGGFINNK